MSSRTFASVFPRQSSTPLILSSINAEADFTGTGLFMYNFQLSRRFARSLSLSRLFDLAAPLANSFPRAEPGPERASPYRTECDVWHLHGGLAAGVLGAIVAPTEQ